MITKTIRSRFDHQIGEQVEGFTILEKRTVIPPCPAEHRRGVYDYVVEVPPAAVKPSRASAAPATSPEPSSFTRATPEEMQGKRIRRLPSR